MYASDAESSETDEYEAGNNFLEIEYKWHKEMQKLQFGPPVKYVYDPLDYAQEIHRNFIKKYYNFKGEKLLFVGMSPGSWGMTQTGVPFADARTVKNWLGVRGRIKWFKQSLPNRIVTGLNCNKVDESGRKFWGLVKQLCDRPENFFKNCFVYNYCPLAFYTETGKVLSLPEIKGYNTQQLFDLCDKAVVDIIVQFEIENVVALGKFIENRIVEALEKHNAPDVQVGHIPHPALTSTKYKANWEYIAIQRLKDLGVYRHIIDI